jgi:hypothetical protein
MYTKLASIKINDEILSKVAGIRTFGHKTKSKNVKNEKWSPNTKIAFNRLFSQISRKKFLEKNYFKFLEKFSEKDATQSTTILLLLLLIDQEKKLILMLVVIFWPQILSICSQTMQV